VSDRDNQRRLDRLAMRYLLALDAGDFDTLELLWQRAETDTELGDMLHALTDEAATEHETERRAAATRAVVAGIEAHLPSAAVVRPDAGPLTVGQVADHLRKFPPRGLTIDELRLNDALRGSAEAVPGELGASQVVAWGRRFGLAPEAYWKAFRVAALKLLGQRESAGSYQMAARPSKPKPAGGPS
jgi:hypothetical protein